MPVLEHWIPGFTHGHPWFSQLSIAIPSQWFNQLTWPGIDSYNQLWSQFHCSRQLSSGKNISFVQQEKLPIKYENYIYETGKIPSRENNWHDLFNFLIWMLMPNTKIALNAAHIQHAVKGDRNPVQSVMAQFDETGVIVCAHRLDFLELLWTHQWRELFVKHRDILQQQLKIIIFGHGLLEKFLNPFLGITGKSLLIRTNEDIFDLPEAEFISQIDIKLSRQINSENFLQLPGQLAPLPMLGVPGWAKNQSSAFYGNVDYFRPCRNYALENPPPIFYCD